MASKYWIKLYHEILDDPKMGRLSDRLWRRTIEMFLLAGDYDKDGELPPIEDVAWRLRTDNETLQQDVEALQRIGILSVNGSIHLVTNFSERQSAMSGAERVSRFRESKRKDEYYGNEDVTDDVTNCYTDIDKDIDKDKEVDTDKDIKDIPTYKDLRSTWIALFPDKPKPRENNKTLAGKVKTRMNSQDFYDNWSGAMYYASKHSGLVNADWFDFAWFVHNDDNYEKVLNGKYNFLDKPQPGDPPKLAKPVDADDADAFFRGA